YRLRPGRTTDTLIPRRRPLGRLALSRRLRPFRPVAYATHWAPFPARFVAGFLDHARHAAQVRFFAAAFFVQAVLTSVLTFFHKFPFARAGHNRLRLAFA